MYVCLLWLLCLQVKRHGHTWQFLRPYVSDLICNKKSTFQLNSNCISVDSYMDWKIVMHILWFMAVGNDLSRKFLVVIVKLDGKILDGKILLFLMCWAIENELLGNRVVNFWIFLLDVWLCFNCWAIAEELVGNGIVNCWISF